MRRPTTALLSALLIVGGVLAACSSDDAAVTGLDAGQTVTPDASGPGPTKTPSEAAATIGNAGGNVTTTEGVGVEIPSGALGSNVQVSVKSAPTAPPPARATTVGATYAFGPSGLQFQKPVLVVLEFDATKLPAGKTAADIVVLTAPDGTTTYSPLVTTVRDANHVTAETTHFSVFVPTIPGPGFATDAGTSNEDAGCVTRLCGFYGPATCGTQSNGCGASLDCGSCTSGSDAGTTDAGCANALTCANYAASNDACGDRPDGCGRTLQCTETCAADAGPGPSDAGGGASDAGGGASDAGPGPSDAGPGPSDAGGGTSDAGGGTSDAGGGASDAGPGPSDAGGGDGGACTPAPAICDPQKECDGVVKQLGCGATILCDKPCAPAPDGGAGAGDASADGG